MFAAPHDRDRLLNEMQIESLSSSCGRQLWREGRHRAERQS